MPGHLELAPRGARHPLRQELNAAAKQERSDDHDLRLFVVAFTAFFVCFYVLIF